MKIESTAFTVDDIKAFMASYRDHERGLLADRLQKVSTRLTELAPRLTSSREVPEGWTAREVLAHIAVVSKYYGVAVHRVASGQATELNLLEGVHMRDVAGEQMAQLEPADILRSALTDQERTIKALRAADSESLRRSARVGGDVAMTAEELARLPLIGHLEMHLEQLEQLLAG
jgi:DinB superfamily